MEMKIKKEAYERRIKELEQEEIAVNSAEEQRQDYMVKIRFVFEGKAKVYATSKEEAKQIVKDSFGMSCGQINTSAPNILDWDIDMKPNKIVK